MIRWHVLDVETNGLDHKVHDITELSLITCENDKIIDIFYSLYMVNELSMAITDLTGLTLDKLSGWPHYKDSRNLEKIKKLIKYPIFAHNSSFDFRFINASNLFNSDYPVVDTLKLCKKSEIKLENNKLQTWLRASNIQQLSTHSALGDSLGLYRLITLNGWQIHALNPR